MREGLSIPLHLPPPTLGTFTSATRKRYCGFAVAVLGLLVHASLALRCLIVIAGSPGVATSKWPSLLAHLFASGVFFSLLRWPEMTLSDSNFKVPIVRKVGY